MNVAIQRTGYESVSLARGIEKQLDQMYREELGRARRYHASLKEAGRLYHLRERFRARLRKTADRMGRIAA